MIRQINNTDNPFVREYSIVGTTSKITISLQHGVWDIIKRDYNIDGYCIRAKHLTKNDLTRYINN